MTTSSSAPPPATAIDVLSTPISQFYTNLHPVALVSILAVNFHGLVRDPVNTLLALAPLTAILQAAFCILCLPSSGNPSPKAGLKKKATKPSPDLAARLVPAFLSFVLTLALSAPLLYIIIILFGAPVVSHHLHTLLLAVHLALLTTPPIFYVHGLEPTVWLRLVSLQQPIDEVYGLALGACVGAWVGAIPIPLDWDREWQKWPVTILCGLYAGAAIGKVLGGHVFKGSKIKMG